MFGSYRLVLKTPGALAFFAPCALARVGVAMTSLGVIWLVRTTTGSYAAAGLVAGGFALSEAAVSPQVARLIDRVGQTRVLPWCLAIHVVAVAALVTIAEASRLAPLLVGAGVVMGMSVPQFGALSAARWSSLLGNSHLLQGAFALEAMSNDVAYLAGPSLVTATSSLVAAEAGAMLAAGLIVTGGVLLVRQHRSAPAPGGRAWRRPGAARRGRGLGGSVFGRLLVANLGLGFAFGSFQVSVIAFAVARGVGGAAGGLYGIMSVASLGAGVVYGQVTWRPRPAQLAIALTLLAGSCLVLASAHTVVLLAVSLVLPGAVIAPSLILANRLTHASAASEVRTQAFTWQNATSAAGVAVAVSVAGSAVNSVGPPAGFVQAAVGVGGAAAVVALWNLVAARHAHRAA